MPQRWCEHKNKNPKLDHRIELEDDENWRLYRNGEPDRLIPEDVNFCELCGERRPKLLWEILAGMNLQSMVEARQDNKSMRAYLKDECAKYIAKVASDVLENKGTIRVNEVMDPDALIVLVEEAKKK